MIEYPDLEIRNEDRLVAESISRVSAGLTADIVNAQIESRRELLKLIEAGLDEPICPELTSANPGSPHTVLLEAMGWTLAQQAFRFNKIPQQNLIAFANLFGIERRAATAAETVLRFTVDVPTEEQDVSIPQGTEVQSEDGLYVFETTEQAERTGSGTVDVLARRTVAGHTLLKPNVLTSMVDNVAFVDSITNQSAIDSGTELESLESTLERVKRYMRRGERIVSNKDLEEAIGEEALLGNGVVRVFPFVRNGEFTSGEKLVGHTTVIVMTKLGDNVDAIALQRIAVLLDTAVGNQFIYIVNPEFVDFDVEFNVRLSTGSPEGSVLTTIERNLRNFYAASREQFGRAIYRSEIIAVIEGTPGVDRIILPQEVDRESTQILIEPLLDTRLEEYQLARLGDVTIHVL